jgi:putative flippase GtrA
VPNFAALTALVARHRAGLAQFTRFALVGGSGVVVNLLVYYAARRLSPLFWPTADSINNVVLPLPWAGTNIRWYMVYSLLAFFVANLTNYQLNRVWTFKAGLPGCAQRRWWSGFSRFFAVGLLAQLIGMAVEVALLHAHSPLRLPPDVVDESTGLRNPGSWAHLIMIVVTIPLSFFLNKFWTFRSRRKGA